MSVVLKGTFRSLNSFNYRVWAIGAIVSNVGTWMQRTAQDWIVLTKLTHNNATAVGIVMALQFGPSVFLLPLTGLAVDRIDRRKLLITTQVSLAILALGLGVLTLTGTAKLWHVYGFALMLGCVTAFDAPARQTFVSELVVEDHLSNAVALNATSFNAARMIGPAIAGVLIASMGAGWVFVLNAASFVAVIVSLVLLRIHELRRHERARTTRAGFADGFRYLRTRPDLMTILFMMFLIATFGLNFPIFISTMSVMAFHAGAGQFGLLTSTMAVGSVTGALLSARRPTPKVSLLIVSSMVFGVGLTVAAVRPNFWLFGACLVAIGVSAQTFTTTANGTIQLTTEPHIRGRVVATLLAIAQGSTLIGAPIVGWAADRFGPRWSLGIGAFAGLAAAVVGLRYLAKDSPGLVRARTLS